MNSDIMTPESQYQEQYALGMRQHEVFLAHIRVINIQVH